MGAEWNWGLAVVLSWFVSTASTHTITENSFCNQSLKSYFLHDFPVVFSNLLYLLVLYKSIYKSIIQECKTKRYSTEDHTDFIRHAQMFWSV